MPKSAASTIRSNQEQSPSRKHILVAVTLFALTSLVFSRTLFNGFIDSYDDDQYVVKNPYLAHGLSLACLKYILTSQVAANWHPVTMLSHALDVQLFGLNPFGHHFVSVLLHSANVAMLYLLLRGATGANWRSAIVAALFAIHPLHVQSVAMIAQRKDLLSTLFLFLAFSSYAVRKPPDRYMLRPIGWLVLSLLSKPMAVTFPLLLLLLDYWPLNRFACPDGAISITRSALRKSVIKKWPILLVVIFMSAITFLVQRDAGATAPIDQLKIEYRVHNTILAYVEYLRLTIWPSKLSAYYPYLQTFPIWKTLVALSILIGITVMALWSAAKRPYFITGWLWYLISLVPVIGIVQVGTQAMADRYSYIPLIGIFVAVVWGVHESLSRKPALRQIGVAVICVTLLVLAIRTWVEIGYWQNAETLWKRALAVTKDNSTAHRNLQSIYVENEQWEDAIEHGYAAIRISPTPGHKPSADPFLGLARSLQHLGREVEALKILEEAKVLYPEYQAVYFEIGSCYMALGKTQEAEQAIHQMPGSPSAIEETLGNLFLNARQFETAEKHYKEAIRIDPEGYSAYLNYARGLEVMGKSAQARDIYARAAALNPNIATRSETRATRP